MYNAQNSSSIDDNYYAQLSWSLGTRLNPCAFGDCTIQVSSSRCQNMSDLESVTLFGSYELPCDEVSSNDVD